MNIEKVDREDREGGEVVRELKPVSKEEKNWELPEAMAVGKSRIIFRGEGRDLLEENQD